MPIAPNESALCRYHYDPLDRLTDYAPIDEAAIQHFYCKNRLATEIQGAVQRSVFQYDDQLLAQQQRQRTVVNTTLLATDLQRSVLHTLDAQVHQPLVYTPYGHLPAESGLTSLLGFNGERRAPVTGHYLLGNGYRAFNPVLMRFNSPDSLSPFGKGGLNAYVYCGGDPVNFEDQTGHMPFGRPAPPARPLKVNTGIPRIPRVTQNYQPRPPGASSTSTSTSTTPRVRPGSSKPSNAANERMLQVPTGSSQPPIDTSNPYPLYPEAAVDAWKSQDAFNIQVFNPKTHELLTIIPITHTQRVDYDELLYSNRMNIPELSNKIRDDLGKKDELLYMPSLARIRPITDFMLGLRRQ